MRGLSVFLAVDSLVERLPGGDWACRQCDYKTSSCRRRIVVRHIKNMHLKITYLCLYCEQEFSRPDKRKEHIKTIHNLDILPSDIAIMAKDKGLAH